MGQGGAVSHDLRVISRLGLTRFCVAVCCRAAVVVLLATGVLSRAPSLQAQGLPGAAPAPQATEASDPLAGEQIAARLAAIQEEIAKLSAAAIGTDPGEPSHFDEELRTLHAIETWLTQQQELVEERANDLGPDDAGDRVTEAEAAVSVFTINTLHEEQLVATEHGKSLDQRLSAQREALSRSKDRLEKAEQKRRTARQRLEAAQDATGRDSAARELQIRKLKSVEASEQVHLRTLEVHRTQEEIEQAEVLRSELEARLAALRTALADNRGSSATSYERLVRAEIELRRERENFERELGTADVQLAAAERRFSRQDDPPAELVEEIEVLTASRDAKRREITIVDERIGYLETRRALLERWERVLLRELSQDELAAAREATKQTLTQLGESLLQKQGRVSGLLQRIERLDGRSKEIKASPRLAALLAQQRATLSHLLELQTADAEVLAADQRLANRVLSDIRAGAGSLDILGYARWFAGGVRDVWQYELTAVDDEPITVASLIIALILVVAGMLLSRRIANVVRRVSVDRFNVELGAAAALETMAFYALLASFTLFALRMVNFPLTAFTVLGGALAIGIGFGSQNVMTNFISGLILMLERPVRAQDVVEVDGMPGTIEQIGARSTQIRSADGRHIIVPNSFFLESNVVNWTLSDDLIRTKVAVGVIYGSPTRLVEQLIMQAVQEDRGILKHPAPIVIFEEFGDNSLNFDVYFWVRARSPMQIRTVQSRIRFRIDDLFRENSLVIAFPQRDVHLDTAAPLDIRVVRAAREREKT